MSPMDVKDGQNIDTLAFSKHFMTGTALHTNNILQRHMQDLVLNKIVIALTVQKILSSLCIYANLWYVAKRFCFSVHQPIIQI